MRCSKCQYISFDNGERCRNCGYEFSLSVEEDVLDLPIRTDEPSGPLADFSLADLDAPIAAPAAPVPTVPTPPPAGPRRSVSSPSTGSGELPLFRGGSRDDDAPLVKLPAVPRMPVSVRKSTVVTRPPQAQPPVFEELELDLDPEDDFDLEEDENTDEEFEVEEVAPVRRAAPVHRTPPAPAGAAAEVAPILPRILAAVIDLGLLIGMDALVLSLTLKACDLKFTEAAAIPVVPFAAFVLLLNGSYVAAFTAVGGQTIGTMLTGIRVVTSEEDAWTDRVPVGPSALRALGYLLSALPAGLGFLPVLIGSERRGVHDRLAHTRVVKA